ncbi:hypothetical protein BC832DRAFT_554991 [Gaertneriomyces semiglobifer]|nr:hypothetical protein BC832DRAFT_554991 [Gaertneriomyces semiglobifer]
MVEEGYVHRSITCNHCGSSPIRGYRYKCANCVDYDVCEQCEARNVHYKTHVFLKIRVPIPPLMNPRSALVAALYPGQNFGSEPPGYDFTELQKISHFDPVELEAFYDQFRSLSTVEREGGGIDKETFEQCLGPLGLEKNLITERIFAFFDRDDDQVISFEELVMGLSILCKGGIDERIRWAFRGYDLNGDGYISRPELHQMFKAYFHLSMELVRDVVKTMEEGMMESFDDEGGKPVSASFAAPIPTGSDTSSDTDDNASDDGVRRENRRTRRNRQKISDADVHMFGTLGSSSNRPERQFPRPAALTVGDVSHNRTTTPLASPELLSPTTPSAGSHPLRRLNTRRSLPHLSVSSPLRMSLEANSPNYQASLPSPATFAAGEEQWPVMEAMSQDAIEEMVDKTFQLAGCEDEEGLSFEDFKHVVELDTNLLAWFEALGSVF